jgi:glutathione S-transferase
MMQRLLHEYWALADCHRVRLAAADLGRPPLHRPHGILHVEPARPRLCGKTFSLADIALYACTHVTDDGDAALADMAEMRAWLGRVAALPGRIAITA